MVLGEVKVDLFGGSWDGERTGDAYIEKYFLCLTGIIFLWIDII